MSNQCGTCCNSGCQTCQLCDQGCMGTCDSCQGFCEVKKEDSNNGFSYSKCVSKDEIIGPPLYENGVNISTWFTRDTWNEAITQINKVFSAGGGNGGDGKGVTNPTTAASSKISLNYTDLCMTADEFKRVATAADLEVSNSQIDKDKVIYGEYFKNLANAVAHLHYKTYQCELCNSSCDIQCDKCQTCDNGCDGCNSQCGNYCCDCCTTHCCDSLTPTPCSKSQS